MLRRVSTIYLGNVNVKFAPKQLSKKGNNFEVSQPDLLYIKKTLEKQFMKTT